MNRLDFSIEIKASKKAIWLALWEDAGYREWTKVFGEGSHMKAESLEAGSIVKFLDAKENGIYSEVQQHIPNQFIEFKHIGLVKEGEPQEVTEEDKAWSGAREIYRIEETDGSNTLIVEIDIMEDHLDFMKKVLPKALEIVKDQAVL